MICSARLRTNVRPARLTLGTAQLGMPYGVANTHGQPDETEAFRLLDYALGEGVSTWDTAPAYGEGEAVIGRFLKGLPKGHRHKPQLSSKLPSLRDHDGAARLEDRVARSLERSLHTLGVTHLDYYLIHDEGDFARLGGRLLDVLETHRRAGLVSSIGLSVYHPDVAFLALEDARVDCFQLPYNLWDRRFEPFIASAKARQKTVFARSVFLQGLLTLPAETVEKKLPAAAPYAARTHKLAQKHQLSSRALAFGFVWHNPAVDSLVVGAETVEQLRANLDTARAPLLEAAQYRAVIDELPQAPETLANPSLWTT